MSFNQININFQKQEQSIQPEIETKNKNQKENLIKKNNNISFNISFPNKTNNATYYTNVIKRKNSSSPNNSALLHKFVDDKKVAYKDITNRIDIDELKSKIKSIIIDTQRIKSCDRVIKNYINKSTKRVYIYHKKTKSSFSCRKTNSSFTTTENESKNSCSVKNIFVNKNITYRNNQQKLGETFSLNLNLNNFYNNKYTNKENKKNEKDQYYSKTLREYLNEQVNNIKIKRNNMNDNNTSIYNENAHNYSIDNESKDLFNNNGNISNDIDNLFILIKSKDENKINMKTDKKLTILTENNSKNICKIKSKHLEEKINYINSQKVSSYLNYKQNKINRINKYSKKKNNKKSNNTFRNNNNINLNLSKHKTAKNLNNNIFNNDNIKTKKMQCINYSKLNNFILSQPLQTNSKINKNDINKNTKNKIYK